MVCTYLALRGLEKLYNKFIAYLILEKNSTNCGTTKKYITIIELILSTLNNQSLIKYFKTLERVSNVRAIFVHFPTFYYEAKLCFSREVGFTLFRNTQQKNI